jgi:3,5-epimerase/4-reductase
MPAMNVLIFGGKGYMGQEFLRLYPGAVAPSVDIADSTAVAKALEEHKPDIVINTAGKTGRPNIDWCEEHKEETVRSNITGPLVLLDECAKRDIYFVHLGSGCIYEGDNGGKGFTEEDPANYMGSFYSRTKAYCDQILREFPMLILRLRMPFDGSVHERNLLSKISKYPRVLDTENSLTYMPDFFAAAMALIEKRKTGIYNIVNPGTMSPFRIMEMYKEIVNPTHEFEKLTMDQLSEVATTGRSNCMLNGEKLASEGIEMRSAEEAVREALTAIASQKG